MRSAIPGSTLAGGGLMYHTQYSELSAGCFARAGGRSHQAVVIGVVQRREHLHAHAMHETEQAERACVKVRGVNLALLA